MSSEHAETIHSVLKDKHLIDNGVWVAFLRDNQLAEDGEGRRYRITKSAIDGGYRSYIGGFININHQDRIRGKIADVRREGEFAYFKPEGLDEEALAVINSPAYRGVSQQSINISAEPGQDGIIDVLSLKGTGVAVALYPKTPGCPLSAGCGLPVEAGANFSLNTDTLNSQISTGGTNTHMAEYTKDQLADMMGFMKDHPDMVTDGMKGIMKGLGCSGTQSTAQPAEKEIAELRKTIEQLTANNALTIKSALEDHKKQFEQEVAHKQEFDAVVTELRSIMKKDVLEKILAAKPTLDVLKSNLEVLRASGLAVHVGAGRGAELTSTEEQRIRTDMDKLGIPRIEFEGAI